MKQRWFVTALAMGLAFSLTAPAMAEEDSQTVDFPQTGFQFLIPDSVYSLNGTIDANDLGDPMGFGSGLVLGTLEYIGTTQEEFDALDDMIAQEEDEDSWSAETSDLYEEYYIARSVPIVLVMGLEDQIAWEDVVSSYGLENFALKERVEIGQGNGYTYYMTLPDYEDPSMEESLAFIPEELIDEMKSLQEEIYTHPEYFAIIERENGLNPPAVGDAVQFETVDLDGNPVSSDDLFSANKVTLVNIWRTWCGPCVAEFPELDELVEEYADQGVGVVTYCANAEDEDTINEAKELVKDYRFQNLAYSDSIDEALPWNCTPMTYIVDGEGKVVRLPIAGAYMDEYRKTIDACLAGETVNEDEDASVIRTATEESAVYSVSIVDQNEDPVPGVVVNFCTDTTCEIAKADENGIITFEGIPYPYHLTILKVPEGYSFEKDDDLYLDAFSSGRTLTVTKD